MAGDRARVTKTQPLDVNMKRDSFIKTFRESGVVSLNATRDMLGTEKRTLRAWMRKSLEALAEFTEQVNN